MKESRKLIIGGIIAVTIFAILISLVGIDEFVSAVVAVPPERVLLLLATAMVGIVAMGLSFFTVASRLQLGLSRFEAVGLFTSINLAHNLTPFGQAGGEPIGAAVVSKRTKARYETCLASITAFDAINVIPAILIFILGGTYVTVFSPSIPHEMRPYLAAFSIFIFIVVSVAGAIVHWPSTTRHLLSRLVRGLNRILGILPLVPSVEPNRLDQALDGYMQAIRIVSSDRPVLVKASTFSTLAFVSQGTMLYLALGAMDANLSLVLAIVIVQISLLASVIPLPGSGGGTEAAQVSLVMILTETTFSPALIAVVLSRGIVFWLPVILGAIMISAVYLRD